MPVVEAPQLGRAAIEPARDRLAIMAVPAPAPEPVSAVAAANEPITTPVPVPDRRHEVTFQTVGPPRPVQCLSELEKPLDLIFFVKWWAAYSVFDLISTLCECPNTSAASRYNRIIKSKNLVLPSLSKYSFYNQNNNRTPVAAAPDCVKILLCIAPGYPLADQFKWWCCEIQDVSPPPPQHAAIPRCRRDRVMPQ